MSDVLSLVIGYPFFTVNLIHTNIARAGPHLQLRTWCTNTEHKRWWESVFGKSRWSYGLQLLCIQTQKKLVDSIWFWTHRKPVSKRRFLLYIFICNYSRWDYQVFPLLLSFQAFRAHLQQGSDPFRGIWGEAWYTSVGCWAQADRPKLSQNRSTSRFSHGVDLRYCPRR